MPRVICLLALCVGAPAAAAEPPVEIVPDVPPGLPRVKSATALTTGPGHHFVGYYGIPRWNASGSRIACLAPAESPSRPR